MSAEVQLKPQQPLIPDGNGAQMGIFEHLDELRRRLFVSAIALVIGTLGGVAVATPVLKFISEPYGRAFIVLDPTGGVVQYFRVAIMVGASLAIPVITYELLMFILPGLTGKEKKWLLISIFPISFLFLVGICFAWFILIPPALGFLVNFQPSIFHAEWTADHYLAFVTSLLFWMGVAFETPLVFFVLSLFAVVQSRQLLHHWRIAIVGAAIAAAVITPTVDPVNMMLVMGPLMALYVLSIVLVHIGGRIIKGR